VSLGAWGPSTDTLLLEEPVLWNGHLGTMTSQPASLPEHSDQEERGFWNKWSVPAGLCQEPHALALFPGLSVHFQLWPGSVGVLTSQGTVSLQGTLPWCVAAVTVIGHLRLQTLFPKSHQS
jgi:hypothetical protein